MKNDDQQLEEALGYAFTDKSLLQKALTHRSYRYENEDLARDNQRLEFLGDAVLGLVAAEYLFDQYHTIQEGMLTKLRSAITNSHALASIARRLSIGNHLLLGNGETKSGGAERDSNLADCLEALLGAIYLDSGLEAVRHVFKQFFVQELQGVLEQPEVNNPKGMLQEFTQKRWQTSPEYVCVNESGPPHDKTFTHEVFINKESYGRGTASNKQQAQVAAALQAIDKLHEMGELQSLPNPLAEFSESIQKNS